MKCEPVIDLDWSPQVGLNGAYRKMLWRRRPGLKAGQTIPALRCRYENALIDGKNLGTYRQLCDVTSDDDIPLLFPHVLMGMAHLQMVSHSRFPLKSFGLLHLRNHVLRLRTWKPTEKMSITCEFARQRITEKGIEFDMDTEVRVGNEPVWQSISTLLKRGKFGSADAPSDRADLFPPLEVGQDVSQFSVPARMGKHYARVSGDYNPIHVSRLMARLSGFPTAIAHGMWAAARAISALALPDNEHVQCDVAFKGPVLLGSQVHIQQRDDRFDLYCGDNPRPVICCRYRTESLVSSLTDQTS